MNDVDPLIHSKVWLTDCSSFKGALLDKLIISLSYR